MDQRVTMCFGCFCISNYGKFVSDTLNDKEKAKRKRTSSDLDILSGFQTGMMSCPALWPY